VREALEDGANLVSVSAASLWELAIKQSLGKLRAPDDLFATVDRTGFAMLDVTARHAIAVAHLPFHHRDPFDRLLVAQAQLEGLTIVTRDRRLPKYDVPVLAA
jgi:PIN domain nuclease of toxin-antitoxin system